MAEEKEYTRVGAMFYKHTYRRAGARSPHRHHLHEIGATLGFHLLQSLQSVKVQVLQNLVDVEVFLKVSHVRGVLMLLDHQRAVLPLERRVQPLHLLGQVLQGRLNVVVSVSEEERART